MTDSSERMLFRAASRVTKKLLEGPEMWRGPGIWVIRSSLGHANGRLHLWLSEANKEAFTFDEIISATLAASEFEVSRSYNCSFADACIFKILAADTS